ncbi:hypothetical protein Droror1_Dr00012985 [Drosera rotundifolia]
MSPCLSPSPHPPKPTVICHHPTPPSPPPAHPSSSSSAAARRLLADKSRNLASLRRRQGSTSQPPRWIRRSSEQMLRYIEDDRNSHLYGKHVTAAIKTVRGLAGVKRGGYDMRVVMRDFVGKLSWGELGVVLGEVRSWSVVRDFFEWMKLQLSYQPSVVVYTMVLRAYGQAGKIKLAEETFLEMLDVGCEPDDIACGTMLCAYARWGRLKPMLSFYSAVQDRGVTLPLSVYNFMMSSLQKKGLHQDVRQIWQDMCSIKVVPNHFTFTVVVCSLVKEGILNEAMKAFNQMKDFGFVPEEATYSLLITASVKAGKQHDALTLYQEMRSWRLVPSNFTCASLLTLYYRNGDYSKALSLFLEMENYKIAADEVIYGLIIKIYGRLGLYEDAVKTYEETRRMGLLTKEKTYLAMAQVHFRSGDYLKVLNTVEEMRSRNIWFSQFSYLMLLKCYAMMGDLEAAKSAYQSLSKTEVVDAGICNGLTELLYHGRGTMKEEIKDFIVQIARENCSSVQRA